MSNFDFIAFLYDHFVKIIFGKKLYDAEVSLFKDLPPNVSVLVIGGGTGAFLHKLIHVGRPREIDYLEMSGKMLELARKRFSEKQSLVRFIHGDENSKILSAQYDIILTPFVLDLYPEKVLTHMVEVLSSKLKTGGVWLVTDFYTDAHSPWYHKILLKCMYVFFGTVSGVKAHSLPDYNGILLQHQLHVLKKHTSMKGFVQSIIYLK